MHLQCRNELMHDGADANTGCCPPSIYPPPSVLRSTWIPPNLVPRQTLRRLRRLSADTPELHNALLIVLPLAAILQPITRASSLHFAACVRLPRGSSSQLAAPPCRASASAGSGGAGLGSLSALHPPRDPRSIPDMP
eukprot:1194451-Rhodomonas_salina.1